ncbi:MAG: PRC-barrel domain-containing protein [Pseudomonadota bacterium]
MHIPVPLSLAAAILALGSAPAFAQDAQTGGVGAFADVAVAELIGQRVLVGNGENVGEVESIVKAGADTMAVLGIGGFLGFGEHDVAVPLTELSPAEGAILLKSMDMEMLQALPAYDGSAEQMPMDVTVAGEPVAPAAPESLSEEGSAPEG